MTLVYIIYENEDWLPPLRREFKRYNIPFQEWFLFSGEVDLSSVPPEGVFINRISPSSHTRGHAHSVDFAREVVNWLEVHGRRVINGSSAFRLEVSKWAQYVSLQKSGVLVPKTIAAVGDAKQLQKTAKNFSAPFMSKPNRGGKGSGVHLHRTHEDFNRYVESAAFLEGSSPDGITLLQQYLPADFITRAEFVDGEYMYSIRADTSKGFNLCPSDLCEVDMFCPVSNLETTSVDTKPEFNRQQLFALREDILPEDAFIASLKEWISGTGIDICGIEFVEDAAGKRYVYDVNTTTNYSPAVEEVNGLNGCEKIALLIRKELRIAAVQKN